MHTERLLADGRYVGAVAIAWTALDRLLGLMGRSTVPGALALWLPTCRSIHTCFMRFPIDVVYVDADLRVIRIHRNVRAWRASWGGRGSRHAFEVRAGDADSLGLREGVRLEIRS